MASLRVIYEPKGAAREYAPLALTLYNGCTHGCRYCYAPGAARRKREDFAAHVRPRKDVIDKLWKDCQQLQGDPREVLLSFMSDPYQPLDRELRLTRKALLTFGTFGMKATVLTKAGYSAMRDFDIMKQHGFSFGTSLSFIDSGPARKWEPGAETLSKRRCAIREAYRNGIRTWVSVEPVIDPEQALLAIEEMRPWVDHWKVGKLNHDKEREAEIDWADFLHSVRRLLVGRSLYVKRDLLVAAGED